MLHKILSGVGFILFITGAAAMDSDRVLIPVAMLIVGSGMLLWSAYEDGYFRKGGKRK